MATKKETKKETYTLEEAEKILAERKKAAREERKAIREKKGFHVGETTDRDATYNTLAVGEWSDGEGILARCTATMENAKGSVIVNVYPHGIFHRGLFARGGDVNAAADAMADMLTDYAEAWAATGKGSIREGLAREYGKSAKTHEFKAREEK